MIAYDDVPIGIYVAEGLLFVCHVNADIGLITSTRLGDRLPWRVHTEENGRLATTLIYIEEEPDAPILCCQKLNTKLAARKGPIVFEPSIDDILSHAKI